MQKKRKRAWLPWLLIVAAAGAGGWWVWRGGNGQRPATYKTVTLERGDIVQSVTANGALGAVQTVTVGCEVSGKIVELFADYNAVVTNGQILARLDASTYERQLEQAVAELDSARANLKLVAANFRRAQELRGLELVSQADYDEAEASLAQAEATLKVREASVSKVRVDLEKTTIVSPMDGVVISRAVDVGQTVAASLNAPTLFTLAQDLREMRIEAQISEADVGGVESGQAVTFTVDAFPERTFTGLVSQVRYEPMTNQGVVNYMAIVNVRNPDLKLRPGMTANSAVITAKREQVVRVPNAALRFRPPENAVIVPAEVPAGDAPPSPAARPAGERAARERPAGQRRAPAAARDAVASHKPLYVLAADGHLVRQVAELGISDGTWTEVVGPAPQAGEQVVTGILSTAEKEAARTASTSPFMPQPPGPRHR